MAAVLSACLGIAGALGACGAAGTRSGPGARAAGPRSLGHVTFKTVDGGPNFFANKSSHSAWMDGHILLGAWMEQPLNAKQVGYDAAMGENIYWNLGGNPKDPSNLRADYNVIRAGGMHVSAPDMTANSGSETLAYDGSDESDMNYGPGTNSWNPNSTTYNDTACIPSGSQCGYTATNFFYSGKPSGYGSPGYSINGTVIHQGYGKGVLFWESDSQAAKFLNYSDILSADSYWLTDTDLEVPSQGGCSLLPNSATACGNGGTGSGLTAAQSQLPANYAYDVTDLERLQAMNGSSKPIVVDVETGCPFSGGSDAGHCATPAQMVAAAWHALIAGARGIIWFQHNFSGPCQDDRTFLDGSNPASSMYNCQQTPGVTSHDVVQAVSTFDQEVNALNGVLLSVTASSYVSASGDVSTLTKAYNGSYFVFAGSGQPATPPPANQSVTFTVADHFTGPVIVIGEKRVLQATSGVFTDTFADANSVHIYSIPATAIPIPGASSGASASVSVVPKTFRAARHSSRVAVPRRGATIVYASPSPANVTFGVYHNVRGYRRGRSCVGSPPSGKGGHPQKCTRAAFVPGSFRHAAGKGGNRFYFAGWLGGHKLAPGKYQLAAFSSGGGPSVRTASFRVIR
jgi:hypothetical protein